MYTSVWVFAVLIVLLAGPSSSQNEDGYLEEPQELVRLPRFAQGGQGAGFTMKDYGFKIIDTGSQYGYESKIPGGRARFVMGSGGRFGGRYGGGNGGRFGGGFGGGYGGGYGGGFGGGYGGRQ